MDLSSHQTGRLRTAMLALTALVCLATSAQEHRSYYIDVTASMVSNNIWDPVRQNLKAAIDKVNAETTTLEVVAWTDSNHPLQRCSQKATPDGKAALKAFIDDLQTESNCYTEAWVPFDDFYKNHKGDAGDSYFFLMTDGATWSKSADKLAQAISNWKSVTGARTYGFYVMLHNSGADQNVQKRIEEQDASLWTVQTADININLLRLQDSDYERDQREAGEPVRIPFSGMADLTGVDIEVTADDPYYHVAKSQINGENLEVHLTTTADPATLPERHTLRLATQAKALPDKFTFLITRSVSVECLNVYVPSVEISFK